MRTLKGPAIFLAQFAGDEAPFNSLDAICEWVSGLGYKGIQIPSWDARATRSRLDDDHFESILRSDKLSQQ